MKNLIDNQQQLTIPLENDLVAKWLQYSQVSASSVVAYNKGIKNLQRFLTSRKTTIPGRSDLIAYREYLGKYQPTTANLYLTATKLFFRFLQVEGYISVNPAEHLKGYRVDNGHKKTALTIEQTKAVLGTFGENLRNQAMYLLMSTCGLRTVEIARAKVEDLVEESGVNRLYVQGKGRAQKDGAVNVPASVFKMIRRYLASRENLTAESPLFASESRRNFGAALTTTSISRILKSAFRRAGFDSKRITAHSLRHTAATVAIKAGAALREVQQLLRHRKLDTTLIYVSELEALKNKAAAMVAASFGFY